MIQDDKKSLWVRPGTEAFLREMSRYYELVIFTAGMQSYADWAIDIIDPNSYIKHRLYRQHALPYESNYIKDLSRLGRPLTRVIIVDNIAESFQLQPENGIMIKTWEGDPLDTAFEDLTGILAGMISTIV